MKPFEHKSETPVVRKLGMNFDFHTHRFFIQFSISSGLHEDRATRFFLMKKC